MSTLLQLQQESFSPSANRVTPEDFFVIASHVTARDKTFLLAHPEYKLVPKVEHDLREALRRRLTHEPVAYIVGHKEFYGRDFLVTKDTLIPRPETEHLVEAALEILRSTNKNEVIAYDIVDVGTGSGNIILSIAKECQQEFSNMKFEFFALDISERALDIAKKNTVRLITKQRIHFLESDLLKKFSPSQDTNRSLLLAANLPYLSNDIWQSSAPDVRKYEPKSALSSGDDGLDHYRRLLDELKSIRSQYSSVNFLLEISPEQDRELAQHITRMLPGVTLRTLTDLSGRSRLIQGIF